MNQGTCLLCFCSTNVLDIKNTVLQSVYEELSDCKVQDSHPLCYYCYTKLLQCQLLMDRIYKNKNENQLDTNPMVHLDVINTEQWSFPVLEVEVELHPVITKEHTAEESLDSNTNHFQLEIDLKREYPCKDKTSIAPISDKQMPTEEQTTNTKHYSCNVCGRMFIHLRNLKCHKRTHSRVAKDNTCNVCKKTYSSPSVLRRHKVIHTDKNRSFKCNICSKTFTQSYHLRTHKITHNSYSCDECDKVYTHRNTLNKHKLVQHKGYKPYSCDKCDKKFTFAYYLKEHQLTHTGDKPDSCDE